MAEKPVLKRTGKRKFFEKLREGYSIRKACLYSGVPRKTVNWYRKNDPEFLDEFNEAMEEGKETLEDVATTRAKKSSDVLLIFLLKAKDPGKYNNNGQFAALQSALDFSGAAESLRTKAASLFAEEEKAPAARKPRR